jgi:hypothetical protein
MAAPGKTGTVRAFGFFFIAISLLFRYETGTYPLSGWQQHHEQSPHKGSTPAHPRRKRGDKTPEVLYTVNTNMLTERGQVILLP